MTKKAGERELGSKGGIDRAPVQQGTCVPAHLLFAERQTLESFYEVRGVSFFLLVINSLPRHQSCFKPPSSCDSATKFSLSLIDSRSNPVHPTTPAPLPKAILRDTYVMR
jgi:hypothetical protein